jgi:uncharacterized repeat protein (TIGR03843 family)
MPADERPPSPGGVTAWSPDGGPGLETATGLLEACDFTVVGRLPWSSNLTYLVALETDSGEPLAAVYKPGSGERDLWDFPDRLFLREVAAFTLSEALGWGIVPPTVVRHDGPFGEGSLQLFVAADYAQHYFTLFDGGGHESALRAMCAFDVVANNADRKSGHVLLGPDDRLWGIDHGLCFHRQPKLRTVIWDFAEDRLPDALLGDLARVADELPPELDDLLSGPERSAVRHRSRRLLETGIFPEPTGDRPPYPWPLV